MARAPSFRIGVDLGGTKIQSVVIDGEGSVIGQARLRTRPEDGYEAVLERLIDAVDGARSSAMMRRREPATVGIGVPGPVNASTGSVLMAFNLGWGPRPIANDLGMRLGRRVVIGNDVNLGALGESRFGAAVGCDSVCALFIGTGLGGAVIINGRVVAGAHGFAGEIGHIPAPFGDALCACGRHGCLETIASKKGIARYIAAARTRGEACLLPADDLRSSQIKTAWDAECPVTRAAVATAARGLGWGFATMGALIDPQAFILGGGIAEALGPTLLPAVAAHIGEYSTFYQRHSPSLRLASLGDYAVAVGAAVAAESGSSGAFAHGAAA